MKIFHHVDCYATVDGVMLEWQLRDQYTPRSFQVLGNHIDRDMTINTPIVGTGRCFVHSDFAGLCNHYRVRVITRDGEIEDSDPVSPQELTAYARRLLREIQRRETAMMRSHPFGSYECTIFLRNLYGDPCPLCGDGLCSGAGGAAIDPGCPICLGTGNSNPYYRYPVKQYVCSAQAKDDKVTGAEGVARNVVVRSFRTVFNGYIREADILMLNNEAYEVKAQEVVASVGNTPAVYMLTCAQLPTYEPRYKVLKEMLQDGC